MKIWQDGLYKNQLTLNFQQLQFNKSEIHKTLALKLFYLKKNVNFIWLKDQPLL